MEKTQQRKFVRGLGATVIKQVLAQVDKVPESWDGWELRQLLADHFRVATLGFSADKDKRRRYKDYRNQVLVDNLV